MTSHSNLEWRKHITGSHRSVGAGDYRIHQSGDHSFTAYKVNPFEDLGSHPSLKAAIFRCEEHYDEHSA